MPTADGATFNFRIPKEIFKTGITDARTYNEAMDLIDELLFGIGGTWKGPVANAAALPMFGNTHGDVRITLDTLTLYAWNGSAWETISGNVGETFTFARAAPITNAYLRCTDGLGSNLSGYPIRQNSTIIGLAAGMAAPSTCTIEILKNGSPTPIATLTFSASTYQAAIVSVPLLAGDRLQCRSSGTSQRPNVVVVVSD